MAIKSGPNWGNSSQIRKLEDDMKQAIRIYRQRNPAAAVQAVLGICYGRQRAADKSYADESLARSSGTSCLATRTCTWTSLNRLVPTLGDTTKISAGHSLRSRTASRISSLSDSAKPTIRSTGRS